LIINGLDPLQSTFTQQDTRPGPDKNGGKEGTYSIYVVKIRNHRLLLRTPDPDTLIHREECPVYNCSTKFYDILIDKKGTARSEHLESDKKILATD
jgi:hypothetical protein